MFRLCSSGCSEKAIKQCLCSGQIFCLKHLDQHLLQPGDHSFIDISLDLTLEQRLQLKDELASRVEIISRCQLRVESQATDLINKIQEFSASAKEKLRKLDCEYRSLMAKEEFSETQREDLDKILKTKLQLNINSHFELIASLEEHFNQEFFSTIFLSKLQEFYKAHTDKILCMATTKDKKILAAGGKDCSIKLWDMDNEKIMSALLGHKNWIEGLSISRNNCYLVSGSDDKTVKVWNLNEGKELFTLKGHTDVVRSVAISKNCKWVVSGSNDKSVCIWSFNEQQLYIKLDQHKGHVSQVALIEDKLFSASYDKKIIEWKFGSFIENSVYNSTDNILCFDVSKNPVQLVAGLNNGTINFWQYGINKFEFTGHTKKINAVKITCGNSQIISASSDKTVRLWSIVKRCQLQFFIDHSHCLTCLASLSDSLVVSGSDDFSMIVWNTSVLSINSIVRITAVAFEFIVYEENRLIYPSFSSEMILNMNMKNVKEERNLIDIPFNSVMIWNIDTDCVEAKFEGGLFTCMASYRDFMVSGSVDGLVNVWSVSRKSHFIAFQGHAKAVMAVAVRKDIIVSSAEDKTMRLWNIKENRKYGVLNGSKNLFLSVSLTSTAETVVSSSVDYTVQVWSVQKLELTFTLTSKFSIDEVKLSTDDKYIFSGSDDKQCVCVWNTTTGAKLCSLVSLEEAEKWLLKYAELKWLLERFLS
jgi:WD40 repeat protein